MKWNLKQSIRAVSVPMFRQSLLAISILGLTLAASAQTITSFEVAGSGSAGDEGTIVRAINSAGTMVGLYFDSAKNAHAYMRTLGGTDTVIDPPGSIEAEATGINTAGVITGAYADSAGVGHGFVLATDGTYTTFSAPGAGNAKGQGTLPIGINAGGVVAGTYKDSLGVSHGFVRTAKGTITQFDGPDAGTNADEGTFLTILFFSNGPVINTAGEIVGYVVDSGKNHHGFVRAANGTMTELNAPGAGTAANEGTVAMGINKAGTIAGYYQDANKNDHGFILATDGTYTDINVGTLNLTIVFGINDGGVVTGTYGSEAANGAEGFVRAANGTVADFIAPDAGDKGNGQGTYPLVVNDAGDVAGLVLDDNQTFAGFIRTP
jgi:hypothetical protein